ncbi:MAG: 2-oxoacid:acceptor oxidoreductase family protein, partial [Candidatus Caldatribacteriaceae bacterium]
PLLRRGEADFMIAFEQMEALRHAPYLKPNGTIILNLFCFYPPGISSSQYPQNIPSLLGSAGFHLLTIPATEISIALGDTRLTNTVLLGAFSKVFPISEGEIWEKAIIKAFKGKNIEANLQAFREGRKREKIAII